MDPMLAKLPPQSIEAEASVLSAVLIENSVLNEVVEILRPGISTKRLIKKYLAR